VDRVQASEDMLRALAGEAALLTRADRVKLVKMLGLLGSAHQGERDAAAPAIE
jgi:hypothetical protein